MITKELYNLVIKANKVAKSCGACNNCLCSIFKNNLEGSNLKHFLEWKTENKGFTTCGSILFYLQDLGIIKILPGAYDENVGEKYRDLKHTIKIFQGNKI